MRYFLAIAIAAFAFALGRLSAPRVELPPPTIITRTERDTIRVTLPATTARVTLVRYDTILVTPDAPTDTTAMVLPHKGDTAMVLPRTQRVYRDTAYTAWVSGYRPTLDSLHLYRADRHFIHPAPPAPARRWSIGLQAGYGLTPRGLQPYIGVGVAYRLL